MNPTLPIPTDNLYKFACIAGLALILASVYAFTNGYVASLATKVQYAEALILLENKDIRSKADDEEIRLKRHLLEVTKANESTLYVAAGILCGIGLIVSWQGGRLWYKRIQQRDDEIANLQRVKLRRELVVGKLDVDAGAPSNATALPPVTSR